MRFTITLKLVLIFLATTGVVLLAALGLARWSFNQGFLDYVNALEHDRLSRIAAELAPFHDPSTGSFARLDPRTFLRIVQAHSPRGAPEGPPPPPGRPPGPRFDRPFPPQEAGRPPVALFDPLGNLVVGRPPAPGDDAVRVPVMVAGTMVGELRALPHRRLTTPRETAFAREQRTATWIIATVGMALAAIISLILARALQAPLRRAMRRVNSLAAGDFASQAPELRSDEFGELSVNLERLATTLEDNRKSRQRWLADISHELRTPVTVLTAELHALRDGIRPLDATQIQSFAQEVERLQRLIDDLYQLSLSEIGGLRYAFAPVDLSGLLDAAVPDPATVTPGLTVDSRIEPGLRMRGDASRLDQLFSNLWQNASAYTDVPGTLRCLASRAGERIHICFEDSPPGVLPEHLDRLFDPLFRTEQSRSRRLAGAGLGLAICRNIVTAHEGTIRAAPSALGGLAIHLDFPAL